VIELSSRRVGRRVISEVKRPTADLLDDRTSKAAAVERLTGRFAVEKKRRL